MTHSQKSKGGVLHFTRMDARPQIGFGHFRGHGLPVDIGGICKYHKHMPCTRLRPSDEFSQKVFHPHPRLLIVSRSLRGRNCFGSGNALGASTYVLEQSFQQAQEWGIHVC